MSENNDNLTGHDYDGIQEYDNPLPIWWLATFLATVIFSFNYWLHYEFAGGTTQLEELKEDLASIQKAAALHPAASGPTETEEDLQKLLGASGPLAAGREVYAAKCLACHGPELQGLVGPNLTDEYWIHGQGRMTDLVEWIKKGVPDKGMPAWEALLKKDELQNVAAFVYSKKGSRPPNPKAPQGGKVVEK